MLSDEQFTARVGLLVSLLQLCRSAPAPGAFADAELANEQKDVLREYVSDAQQTFESLISHVQEKITT